MIVPEFWAEARARHEQKGRQITVRRFGWSDASASDAQSHADARAAEALARLVAGERLPRRDLKIPYNGAQGLPIREEIVSRHGETIITRNGYGARCLNTPSVLFADIDFSDDAPLRFKLVLTVVLMLAGCLAGWLAGVKASWFLLLIPVALFGGVMADRLYRAALVLRGGPEGVARARVRKFLSTRDDWNLRLYRTPAGLRLLATHRRFATEDPEVAAFFAAVGADPLYVRMCLNQKCFRARVSAKPWRIGISQHLKPRPGVWPVAPESEPQRKAWVASYEAAARGFSACTLIESIGSGRVDPEAARVMALHDQLCGATRSLPMA